MHDFFLHQAKFITDIGAQGYLPEQHNCILNITFSPLSQICADLPLFYTVLSEHDGTKTNWSLFLQPESPPAQITSSTWSF